MQSVRHFRTSARCVALVLRAQAARTCMQSPRKPGTTLTGLAQTPRKVEEIRIRHQNGRGRSTRGKIVFLLFFLLFLICLFAYTAHGKQPDTRTAKVRGTVFVQDSAGHRSGVAGAKVKFNGPAGFET